MQFHLFNICVRNVNLSRANQAIKLAQEDIMSCKVFDLIKRTQHLWIDKSPTSYAQAAIYRHLTFTKLIIVNERVASLPFQPSVAAFLPDNVLLKMQELLRCIKLPLLPFQATFQAQYADRLVFIAQRIPTAQVERVLRLRYNNSL